MSWPRLVSKQDFTDYENTRRCYCVDTFDVKEMAEVSRLSCEKIVYIMHHYNELRDRYVGKKVLRTKNGWITLVMR